MNEKIVMTCATNKAKELGGVIVKVKSHNARENMVRLLGSSCICGLISIKWVLYSSHSAADGYFLITAMATELLKKQNSRWSRSISYPKKVPLDLDKRIGGIFG